LLPDRRADVDPFIPDIESDALDRVIIDPYVDTMRTGTQSRVHFALHGMVAAACQPIDNSAGNEVAAKILGKAIELVNVAFSITDVNTPVGLPLM